MEGIILTASLIVPSPQRWDPESVALKVQNWQRSLLFTVMPKVS
jgi:hypothetical protein